MKKIFIIMVAVIGFALSANAQRQTINCNSLLRDALSHMQRDDANFNGDNIYLLTGGFSLGIYVYDRRDDSLISFRSKEQMIAEIRRISDGAARERREFCESEEGRFGVTKTYEGIYDGRYVFINVLITNQGR